MRDRVLARRVLDHLLAHYGRQYWWNSRHRLENWLSMILIQRRTEANAKRALECLIAADAVNVTDLLAMPLSDLQAFIRSAGFYRQKAVYIKAAMQSFADYDADFSRFKRRDTADLRQELLNIKGVGQETADCMVP